MGMMNWGKGGDDEADEERPDEDEFDLDGGDIDGEDALDDEWDDGLEDEWGDDFGDDEDAVVHELQDKVNGMESELGGVSSSMKTVKEENKRIAETVDELDDTIRKLLDVYEIVTRGINPFIDDAQAMANMNNEGSFGLFGDVEEEDGDALDPTLAGADAESFFDDEFDDRAPDPEEELTDPPADDPGDALGGDADAAEAGGGGGGVSFEDLKAEYESGDDWEEANAAGADDGSNDESDDVDGNDELPELDEDADDDAYTDETVEFDDIDDLDGFDDFDDFDADDLNDFDDFDADDLNDFDDFDGEEAEDDPGDAVADERVDGDAGAETEELLDAADEDDDTDGVEDERDAEVDDGPEPADVETNGSGSNGHARATDRFVEPEGPPYGNGDGTDGNDGDGIGADGNGSGADDAARGPDRGPNGDYYLARVPDDYVAELLLMEWAEALVSVGGTAGAMDACRYYERLGWISPSVGDRLTTHVLGSAVTPDPDGTAPFAVDDHVRSLGYVSRLGGDPSSRLVELAIPGGEYGGIRG